MLGDDDDAVTADDDGDVIEKGDRTMKMTTTMMEDHEKHS